MTFPTKGPTITSFTGSIQGSSFTQGRPSNVICPSKGQTVNLNCTTNSIYNTINITSPNGTVYINTSPTFIVESEHFGTYTCAVSNDCGQQTQMLILKRMLTYACKYNVKSLSSSIRSSKYCNWIQCYY